MRSKIKGVVFCLVLVAAIVSMGSGIKAEAAFKEPKIQTSWDLYRKGNSKQDTQYLSFKYLPKKFKIVQVKSSKPGVAKAFIKTWDSGVQNIGITMKKAGTTKLTIKVKVASNTYTFLKTTVVVNKHKNVFSSLKVGSTQYKNKFKKAEYIDTARLKGQKKVTVKAVKGWEVESISYVKGKTTKTIKNGAKLNFNKVKGEFQLVIEMKNTTTEKTRTFTIYYS